MQQPIWRKTPSLTLLNQRSSRSFSEYLGIQFTQVDPNALYAQMHITPHLLQPMGIMHGGASCALAESVGSAASFFCIEEHQTCVGLNLFVNHIRAVKQGTLTAKASPMHLGRSTQVWEIWIQNEEEKLTTLGRLTVSILDQKHKNKKAEEGLPLPLSQSND